MYYNLPIRNDQLKFSRQNSVNVIGEGVIKTQPNIAFVSVGVSTEHKQAKSAQSENAILTSKIVQSLQSLGIQHKDIKTVNYQINTLYYYKNGTQTFRGYEVTHIMEIKIKNINEMGTVIDIAVNSGANIVKNINFTVSNYEQYYNDALSQALINAKRKALTITNKLNVLLNETPIKIAELSHINEPNILHATSFTKSTGTEIMTGQIEIKAVIKTKFIYF